MVKYIKIAAPWKFTIKGDVIMKLFKKAALWLTSIAVTAVACSSCFTAFAEEQGDDFDDEFLSNYIDIVYTNDVHNAYEQTDESVGYAAMAAKVNELKNEKDTDVILVDGGDAIQGGILGALSKEMWAAEIMDKMGYDVAVPGNHEFDFGVERLLEIADSVSYDYVCCNFIDLRTGKTVFKPYKMIKKFDTNIAFIGITTPETYTMSNPNYFKDESGKDIYSFCGGDNGKELYKRVQDTIDEAKNAGADMVMLVGHTGIDPSSSPWTTGEIIANTMGVDGYFDGHSHSVINLDMYKNNDSNVVPVFSTGTKMQYVGCATITERQYAIERGQLFDRKDCDKQDSEMLEYINGITDKIKETSDKVIGKSDVTLCMNDPVTDKRLVRQQETNLGDFCADAYREVMGADIAFINGGGLRADIAKGDITVGDLIAAHPFGNLLCTAEISGQTILDMLEMSVQYAGDLSYEDGSFQHVSGITFDVDTTIPSPVVTDENKLFVKIDGERRVNNVMVGDEPIDPEKIYTVASHNYLLKNCGGGFTMLENCKIVKDETVLDYEALITYVTDDYMGGVISEDSGYSDPYGQKRIRLYNEKVEPTCEKDGSITYLRGDGYITETLAANGHEYGEWTEENGVMKRVCKVCGKEETKNIDVVPGDCSGEPANPPTGEPVAMTAVIITALSAVVLATARRKEK